MLVGDYEDNTTRKITFIRLFYRSERSACTVIGWYRQNKVLWILFSQNGCTNVGSENLGIGPSGVRALSLAAGMNEGGHYGRQI